jgi:hypothetical protein
MTWTSDAPWVAMYSSLLVLLLLAWTYIPA